MRIREKENDPEKTTENLVEEINEKLKKGEHLPLPLISKYNKSLKNGYKSNLARNPHRTVPTEWTPTKYKH